MIKREYFGSAVRLVDIADIKVVGQREFLIVMSDGKRKIAAEPDRRAGFVIMHLPEFYRADAIRIGQLFLRETVGDKDLEWAGLRQRGKVIADLTARGYEAGAVRECEGADEVTTIAAVSNRVAVDNHVLIQKTDGLLVPDKGRSLPVDGNGLIGLVKDTKFDLSAIAGYIVDETKRVVFKDKLI